ncbi:MAG: response regulator transcription factor [Campylobacterales bacterium]
MSRSSINYTKALHLIGREMTVLYAEDDERQRAGIVPTLEALFGRVIVAPDGESALRQYETERCDLVISDIRMPKMDGIALCGTIKGVNPDQMVVVVSAHEETEYLLELINMGVDAFLTKPVRNDVFIRTLYKAARIVEDRRLVSGYEERLEVSNLEMAETLKKLREAQIAGDRLRVENILLDTVRVRAAQVLEKEALPAGEETLRRLLRTSFRAKVPAREFASFDVENKIEDLEAAEALTNLAINSHDVAKTIAATRRYAAIFNNLPDFTHMGYVLDMLSELLAQNYKAEAAERFFTLYACMVDDLGRWREEVLVKQTAIDIHYMDASIINSYLAIRGLFANKPAWADDENELELF